MTAWGLVSLASLVATGAGAARARTAAGSPVARGGPGAPGAVAAYVFLRVPRTVSSLPFGLLMLSFAMWNLGDGLASLAPAPDPGLMPLIRLARVGGALPAGAVPALLPRR